MADITVIDTATNQEMAPTQEPVYEVATIAEDTKVERVFLSLEDILGKDTEELTKEAQGHFVSERLGDIPFTAISYDDYKQAKKDCVTYAQDDNGVIQTKVDDDKLMTKIIILAVDKDTRSNFTFASSALLNKLGVFTAEMVLAKLLSPGEIVNFSVAVQNASGFGTKKKQQVKESVKNS